MRDFGDLYALTTEQLENLVVTPREPRSERAVPRKLGNVGRNVVEQIDRSRKNDLSRLVYALGIRHIGEKAASTIARHLRTMQAILDAPLERLQAVPDVGPSAHGPQVRAAGAGPAPALARVLEADVLRPPGALIPTRAVPP